MLSCSQELSNHLSYLYPGLAGFLPSSQHSGREDWEGVGRNLGGGDVDWEKAAEHPPDHLPWGTTPVKHPKITVTTPAQQGGPVSTASIYRFYDGLGRGEFLSRASHPSGKIKKEKAEIFSFHQNRKELGEVGGGWEDKGWGLRRTLHPVVVFREGRPGAPARRAHRPSAGPVCPRRGPPWPPRDVFIPSLPGLCTFMDTHRCPRAHRPVSLLLLPAPPPVPLIRTSHRHTHSPPRAPTRSHKRKGLTLGGWHLGGLPS